jgi:hypothetical protein
MTIATLFLRGIDALAVHSRHGRILDIRECSRSGELVR